MLKLSFIVPAEFVNQINEMLLEEDTLSISMLDADVNTEAEEAIFGEHPNQDSQYWKRTIVNISVLDQSIANNLINKIQSESNLDIQFNIETIADIDWVKQTQSQFNPIQINEKLWIIPTWHQIQQHNAINIILDPGLAFGTGSHPTTQLCLNWLTENIRPSMSCLDYGCGSGILAIAAEKLGAQEIIGTDIDLQAIQASIDNAKNNHCTLSKFISSEENISGQYDIVVANILSSALKVLAPVISNYTKSHGKIALSGILKQQEDEIKVAYKDWFEFDRSQELDGWLLMSATKKPKAFLYL